VGVCVCVCMELRELRACASRFSDERAIQATRSTMPDAIHACKHKRRWVRKMSREGARGVK
jgi:hypothetical protein